MLKKILFVIMVLVMGLSAVGFVACNNNNSGTTPEEEEKTPSRPYIVLSRDNVEIKVDGGIAFTAKLKYEQKEVEDVVIDIVSADESIAVYEDGYILGKDAGTTTITASATYKEEKCEAVCTVVVKDDVHLVFEKNSVVLKLNNKVDADTTHTVQPSIKRGENVLNVDSVSYSSENTDIATVDEAGKISSVAPGSTRIVVTAKLGEKTYEENIYVTVEKSFKEIEHSTDEVYKGIELVEGALKPVANKIELDVSEYAIEEEIKEIKIVVEGRKNIAVEKEAYALEGGKISINAGIFGSSNYGEVEVTAETDKTVYKCSFGLVTKFITTGEEMRNIMIFGGVRYTAEELADSNYKAEGNYLVALTNEKAFAYNYDGYFVLKNDITMSVDKRLEGGFVSKGDYHDCLLKIGFKGIFDGCNNTIFSRFVTEGYAYTGESWIGHAGLFGNVSNDGVVKNVNIIPEAGIYSGAIGEDNYAVVLGYSFCGLLQNVCIEVKVAIDDNWNGTCYAIATMLGGATLENVVVNYDLTHVNRTSLTLLCTHTALCNPWNDPTVGWRYEATFSNVFLYYTNNSANAALRLAEGKGLTDILGLKAEAANKENAVLPSTLEADKWELVEGVPRIKKAK